MALKDLIATDAESIAAREIKIQILQNRCKEHERNTKTLRKLIRNLKSENAKMRRAMRLVGLTIVEE